MSPEFPSVAMDRQVFQQLGHTIKTSPVQSKLIKSLLSNDPPNIEKCGGKYGVQQFLQTIWSLGRERNRMNWVNKENRL